MISEDGETIEWKHNLVLDGPAESWLLALEHTMRVVLREVRWIIILNINFLDENLFFK